MAIGSKLKKILEERGITVKAFAQQLGIAPTTLYSFIDRDSSTVKTDLLLKICIALDMDIFELMDATPEEATKITNVFSHPQANDSTSSTPLYQQITKAMNDNEPTTIAAHFDGDEYTEEELEKIKEFAAFIKANRKKD